MLSETIIVGQNVAQLETAPDGNGQLETAPTLFKGGIDDQDRNYFLNGQPAKNGKLILTAQQSGRAIERRQ